jgi:S1-C subfamily serine protease
VNSLELLSTALEDLVARTAPSVVAIEHYRGHGSGVVLAPDGYVLTNHHVVEGRKELGVGFADGSYLQASAVGLDPRTDLAVLHVAASDLPALPLADSKSMRVGQLVVAIGNPLRFERSVSLGVVSALDRSLAGPRGVLFEGLIQTDAAINPGNSGGPLVNAAGQVVGISTAIVPYAQGLGFAVPAHTASWVSAILIQKGEVKRPFLGIAARGVELTAAVARELGQSRAVRIFEVTAGTPAAAAGLQDGDLVLTAGGHPLSSVDDLQRVMVLDDSGELELDIFRERRRAQVRIAPRRASPRAA